MRLLLLFALFALFCAGCTTDAGGSKPASSANFHTPGTDVGTSNPGVNQPTQTTTATRANDTPSR